MFNNDTERVLLINIAIFKYLKKNVLTANRQRIRIKEAKLKLVLFLLLFFFPILSGIIPIENTRTRKEISRVCFIVIYNNNNFENMKGSFFNIYYHHNS